MYEPSSRIRFRDGGERLLDRSFEQRERASFRCA